MTPDYQRSGVELYLGDCLEVLPTLGDGAVDAVVADPSYGIDYQSNWCVDGPRFERLKGDAAVSVDWVKGAARCASSAMVCFCRWDTREDFRAEIARHMQIKSAGVWDRMAHGMGDLNGSLAPRHDDFWFATHPGFRFIGGRLASVLPYMRVSAEQMVHPTEKPVSLMVAIVRAIVGDRCLDPFMGSGTTGVACVKLGRKFIGIELDRRYFDIAVKRIDEAFDSFALLDAAQPAEVQGQLEGVA